MRLVAVAVLLSATFLGHAQVYSEAYGDDTLVEVLLDARYAPAVAVSLYGLVLVARHRAQLIPLHQLPLSTCAPVRTNPVPISPRRRPVAPVQAPYPIDPHPTVLPSTVAHDVAGSVPVAAW